MGVFFWWVVLFVLSLKYALNFKELPTNSVAALGFFGVSGVAVLCLGKNFPGKFWDFGDLANEFGNSFTGSGLFFNGTGFSAGLRFSTRFAFLSVGE